MSDNGNELDEMLAKWDAGDTIWSVELGGLGPGYEQAIQIAAVEMARDGRAFAKTGDDDADHKAWDDLCTASARKHDDALGGLSGAQYGAARWLAFQWVANGGPAELQARAKAQNRDTIQVSRNFPRAPDPTP